MSSVDPTKCVERRRHTLTRPRKHVTPATLYSLSLTRGRNYGKEHTNYARGIKGRRGRIWRFNLHRQETRNFSAFLIRVSMQSRISLCRSSESGNRVKIIPLDTIFYDVLQHDTKHITGAAIGNPILFAAVRNGTDRVSHQIKTDGLVAFRSRTVLSLENVLLLSKGFKNGPSVN